MGRRGRVVYVSLRSSLVNLPISIYGPLVERNVRPQRLAVHLVLGGTEAYVGWTGLASSSSLAHFQSTTDGGVETVEIDPQFAQSLGLAEGVIVDIGLLYDLQAATMVVAEPLTSDDWEIIELHAPHIEQTLLSQVRVACASQQVDIWVLGRTRVRLRIVSITPPSTALLLTTNTELSIAPKLRATSTASSLSLLNRSSTTTTTTTTSNRITPTPPTNSNSSPSPILRVLPKHLVSRPAPPSLPQNQIPPSNIKTKAKSPEPLHAYVSEWTFCTLTGQTFPLSYPHLQQEPARASEAQSAPSTSQKSQDPIHSVLASIRRGPAPIDPTSSSTSSSSPSPSQDQTTTPQPRVLKPKATLNDADEDARNGSTNSNQSQSLNKGTGDRPQVVLTYYPTLTNVGLPDLHVYFSDVPGCVEEWDLVRFTILSPARTRDREQPASSTVQEALITLPHANGIDDANNTGLVIDEREDLDISGLVGMDALLERCTKWCFNTFMVHEGLEVVRGVPSILITGKPGSGKTSVAREVAKRMQEDGRIYAYTFYVDVAKYASHPLPIATLKSLFKYWYAKAAFHRPSVLVLDGLDKLLMAEVEHADSSRTRHLTELFLPIFSSSARTGQPNSKYILTIATADSASALHPLLHTLHVFEEVVELKALDKTARRDILNRMVKRRVESAGPRLEQDPSVNYTILATQTEGYSPVDLQDLVARAVHQAVIRSAKQGSSPSHGQSQNERVVVRPEDFETAQVDFTPLSLRDIKLQTSSTFWADIGGLQEAKRILRETMEWPTKYGPIFAQSPLRLRSGVLLFGYPGCGKTLLASAVAKECGLSFISVKGPEVLNKYIGASEKAVRDLFERASAAQPCVLFFDEFDAIAPKRGHDSTGVTDRVVNQMLTQLDGVEGLTGVYVLAATSRPDLIDPALLRPGRLDKAALCDMPKSEERREILEALSRKVKISEEVEWTRIAQETEGYSGADLQALVYNAHLEVVHGSITDWSSSGAGAKVKEGEVKFVRFGGEKGVLSKAEEDSVARRVKEMVRGSSRSPGVGGAGVGGVQEAIEMEHLQTALGMTRPSVSWEERVRLQRIYDAFTSDRTGDLAVPPDGVGVGNRVSLM